MCGSSYGPERGGSEQCDWSLLVPPCDCHTRASSRSEGRCAAKSTLNARERTRSRAQRTSAKGDSFWYKRTMVGFRLVAAVHSFCCDRAVMSGNHSWQCGLIYICCMPSNAQGRVPETYHLLLLGFLLSKALGLLERSARELQWRSSVALLLESRA
jgi:hypothetical protein